MDNNNSITKIDLEKFATKNDFKKELAKFATKKDLKGLEQKMDTRFKDQIVFLRQEIKNTVNNAIDDKLGQWKSELFNIVDGLAVEIRDGREHREITSYQIVNNRERIEKLEHKVFGI